MEQTDTQIGSPIQELANKLGQIEKPSDTQGAVSNQINQLEKLGNAIGELELTLLPILRNSDDGDLAERANTKAQLSSQLATSIAQNTELVELAILRLIGIRKKVDL